MEHQKPVHSQPERINTGSRHFQVHSNQNTRNNPITSPFSTPDYVKSAEFLSLRGANVILLKAAERHFRQFFSHIGGRDTAVVVSDADGIVMDLYGDPVVISDMTSRGISPGLVTAEYSSGNNVIDMALRHETTMEIEGPEHYLALWRKWHWVAHPIVLADGRLVGICAGTTNDSGFLANIKMLIQSASVALANWMELEEKRQNLTRLQHTVISQLDYHVFFLEPSLKTMDERHPIPISELARSEMRQIASSGLTLQKEMLIDNRLYKVDVRKLTDYKGAYKGTLGLFKDVSRSKRWETQLRDMEKMSTLNSLAAGIAHEIRNPLTAAKGFLQLFTERMENVDDRRFLDLTLTELERINGLVKDFMSLARPEPVTYRKASCNDIVHDSIAFIQPEAALHGVVFDIRLPEDTLWVYGDSNQLKQVLLNIGQNALQACAKVNGNVEVSLQERGSKAVITVRDTGLGMDQKQLAKLFQPFFTTKETGTGLGLVVSRRIIEEHGGTIDLESTVNVGTTVTITLDLFL